MWFLLGFVSLFFISALGFFTWATYSDARQQTEDQLTAAVSQAVIPLEILFMDLVAQLNDLVLDEWLPAVISRGRNHQVFFDRNGRPVGIEVPIAVYQRALQDARKTGAPTLTRPFQRGDEWRAIILEPRYGTASNALGFVGIEFSLSTLLDWWRPLRTPPNSVLSLYMADNQTWLRHSPPSPNIATRPGSPSEIKILTEWHGREAENTEARRPAVGAALNDDNGTERLIAWRQLATLGLTLVVSTESRQVFANWRRQHLASFLISLAVSLLAIGIVALVNLIVVRETRRREAALGELRVITNNLPVLIAYIDAAQRFRFINATGARWFARPILEIIRKTPKDVLSPATYRKLDAHIERVISGQTETFESLIDFGDGMVRDVRVTFVPHHHQRGGVIGFFALSEDLTEQKKIQDQLRQAQKMEAIGQLTGGIAHDFNNLLTVIIGNLELLMDQSETPDGPKGPTSAAFQAARRGGELTQRLLAFARKQPLKPVALDLNQLIAGMTGLLERTLGGAIDIITVEEDELWRCAADPSQVENMLLNLAINARDAMPDGGQITFKTENVTVDEHQIGGTDAMSPGRYVMLSVSDTGIGMSQDVLENAFDPFFTTKDVGRGSGLGLSMVHGFVRQTGGDVRIDSSIGKGTTVQVFLPKATEETKSVKTSTERRPEGSASALEKVLVVDDDAAVRAIVMAMMSRLGYPTLEAVDGPSALAVLEANPDIELLLTDIVMSGGMNGFQLAEQARRRNPAIKLLFTSGHNEKHNALVDGEFQGAAILTKPYRRNELSRNLRQILGRD